MTNTNAPAKPAAPRKVFRPWGTDSIGDVVDQTKTNLRVRYRHEPERVHDIPVRDLDSIGRFVNPTDFR